MLARFLCLAVVLGLSGCTTLQPVAGSAPELRQQIAAGQLLKSGDRVVITTADGKRHRLVVAATDSASVRGKRGSIAISEIDGIQRPSFSAGRTTALILAIGVGACLAGEMLAAPAAIFQSTH